MNIHSAIQDAIKKCNLVFFVGAGFSQPLGLPNWTGLVKIITDDLKRDYPDDAFISNIVEMIRQKYYTEIEALDKLKAKHLARILEILEKTVNGVDLGGKDLTRHEKIWQITDQVVTTNYDEAFERVLPSKLQKVVYEDDFHVARLSELERFLFKAHGSIEHPAKCVLFSDQYKKLYDGQTGATLELFRILADKTIVFLGFSLNDPFVNELLTLRQRAYNGQKQNHFIITTDDKDFTVFGVERIGSINNYANDLDEFLDELVRIRGDYPYGLGMLVRGLARQGKEFNIEVLRKNYFELLSSLEEKPESAAVAEKVRAGEFENAEEKLRKELETELKTARESRQKAAEKAYELANLKKLQLKFKEALTYYQQAVEFKPDDALYLNSLGRILDEWGQYGKAIESYERSLAIVLEEYGDQHPETATRYNNIGFGWSMLGEYKKAIDYYNKALAIDQKNYGERHPNIATDYNNIGAASRSLGEYKKAIDYYDKALAIDLEVYGDRHPNAAIRYNNIGYAWSYLGEYNKALDYYEKALAIDLEVYGDRHPNIAIRYNNIGFAWNNLGDYNKALDYYEKALAIDLEVYGDQHPNVAIRFNNIGEAWRSLGEYKKALDYYEKALAIDLKTYGERHPDTAVDYNNIAVALGELGEPGKSIGYYEKALKITTEMLGSEHPTTRMYAENLEITRREVPKKSE